MSTNEKLYIKTRQEWRAWLKKNYNSKERIWLVYFKKHTKKPSISYSDAVEEAICFGWIDGQVKKIDDEKYMQRYTPRREKSHWSELNIKRAKKMIKQKLMMKKGLEVFEKVIKDNKLNKYKK